jgi:co-chaperonin GroES (HSP10)
MRIKPDDGESFSFPPKDQVFSIGATGFEALGERVLVLVDPFRSGYECERCNGDQKISCTDCDNGKSRLNPNMQCKTCSGSRAMVCPACGGKGGELIIPDVAENRPQTGTIVSVGDQVGRGVQRLFGAVPVQTFEERKNPLKKGDRVLFGTYAGFDVKLDTSDGRGIELRILNESEVLTRVHGEMKLRRMGRGSREELL